MCYKSIGAIHLIGNCFDGVKEAAVYNMLCMAIATYCFYGNDMCRCLYIFMSDRCFCTYLYVSRAHVLVFEINNAVVYTANLPISRLMSCLRVGYRVPVYLHRYRWIDSVRLLKRSTNRFFYCCTSITKISGVLSKFIVNDNYWL